MTKYLAKGFDDDRLDGKKRYFASKGLLKSLHIRDQWEADSIAQNIPAEYLTFEKTYQSAYNGKVDYKIYELGRGCRAKDVLLDVFYD
jgi:hypothetical protein